MDKIVQSRLNEVMAGNLTVYNGYLPFVGAGSAIGGWSFALDIRKGKEELGQVLEAQQFQSLELYDFMQKRVNELQLVNVSVEDALFAHGQEIRDNPDILPDYMKAPKSTLDAQRFIDDPNHSSCVRHYKCVRVTSWQGELILSIFIRFIVDKYLFVEASYYLLPPLTESFREIDHWSLKPTDREMFLCAIAALAKTPFLLLTSPLMLLESFAKTASRDSMRKENLRLLKEDMNHNYGAISSLRADVASPLYRRYFQLIDKDRYLKVIERQILDSICEFLNIKQIDTSEIKEKKTTIENHGVIISGGSINTDNLAVGRHAKASSLMSMLSEGKKEPELNLNSQSVLQGK